MNAKGHKSKEVVEDQVVKEEDKMEACQNESLFDSEILGYYYAIPNYFNGIVLTLGVFGMYKSIEIEHSVYAILFADLVSTLVHVLILLVAFHALNPQKYFPLHNFFTGSCLLIHCVCWCSTMVLRYLYVVHEEWVYGTVPDMKHQRLIALGLTASFVIIMFLAMVGTALIFGK